MKKRILFVQPSVNPPGGDRGVVAWMLEWLAAHHEVTLLTTDEFIPKKTDAYYGTNLQNYSIKNILYKNLFLDLLRALPASTHLLQLHLLMRHARFRARDGYDLVCSAFGEQHVGVPCVEYVHYPWGNLPRPDAPPSWNENTFLRGVIAAYTKFCGLVSGFDPNNRRSNLTLVNSNWTGGVVQRTYPGTSYQVLNPPALLERIDDDRTRRRPRFLSVGRIAAAKEWEKLIDIVAALRERGHDVGLTLAGSRDHDWYEESIRERIEAQGDWLKLVTDFTRQGLMEMMVTHKYGMHGMREEHYGMAVAELVLGGCLTMVPNDGGQVEIVTDHRLRYDSVEDAVEKWDRVLRDPVLEAELLTGQQAHRSHLTKERFVREFAAIVERCLELGVERVAMGDPAA